MKAIHQWLYQAHLVQRQLLWEQVPAKMGEEVAQKHLDPPVTAIETKGLPGMSIGMSIAKFHFLHDSNWIRLQQEL